MPTNIPTKAVYLDYSATTPVDPRVAERMGACLLTDGAFGNPASRSHVYGWEAEELVEEARTHVAALFNADPREIIWTSGATESDNLAIKGVVEASGGERVVTSSYEHKAVLDTCAHLESLGLDVTYIEPDAGGIIQPEAVADAIDPDTAIVSVMHANNEIGVVNDIRAIGAVCRERGVPFHTDAAQSVGKIDIDVRRDNIDLMSVSGHKIYGPKGIGVLFVRRQPFLSVAPQIHGGGHERGMRSGTLATHQIVGIGEACVICREELDRDNGENRRIRSLRDRLWSHLRQLPKTQLNGDEEQRLPGNLNVFVRRCRRRYPADRARRPGGLHRLRLHLRHRGAVLRPEGARSARRSRPRIDPVHGRPLHHHRRSGLRGAPGGHHRGEAEGRPRIIAAATFS